MSISYPLQRTGGPVSCFEDRIARRDQGSQGWRSRGSKERGLTWTPFFWLWAKWKRHGKSDELFAGTPVPVFLPMDEDHPVDDCVGLIIGGRENYYEEQCKCAGTMFMNSGFARHWESLGKNTAGPMGSSHPGILKRLLANYQRTLSFRRR